MSIYIETTLNRVAKIENNNINIEEFKKAEDEFISSLEEIVKKYKVKIEINNIDIDDYNGLICVIHNEVEKIGFATCLYEGVMVKLPEAKNDDTFLERTQSFLKEATKIDEIFEHLVFDEPQKRSFCFS